MFTQWFNRFAQFSSRTLGSPLAFLGAILLIVIWGALGPAFGYSDTWQLAINTTTTIVTFLMVFLIQNTQNRDARIFHLKLDELVRAIKEARTRLIDMDELSEEELCALERELKEVGHRAEKRKPCDEPRTEGEGTDKADDTVAR